MPTPLSHYTSGSKVVASYAVVCANGKSPDHFDLSLQYKTLSLWELLNGWTFFEALNMDVMSVACNHDNYKIMSVSRD